MSKCIYCKWIEELKVYECTYPCKYRNVCLHIEDDSQEKCENYKPGPVTNLDGMEAIDTLIELCSIKKEEFDGECGDCAANLFCGSTIYGWKYKRSK